MDEVKELLSEQNGQIHLLINSTPFKNYCRVA
jgi:hypothetical protein